MEETPKQINYNSFIYQKPQFIDDIIDYQEYFILNDNIIYKIVVGKNRNEIFIKCKNYIISFNHIELSKLINIEINTLNEAFIFIMNIFEDNKVKISKIIKNEEIELIIDINNEKNIDITLIYDKYNNENYDPI